MNVLVEAKKEYTKQLVSILMPQIYVGIQSIYNAAKDYCDKSMTKISGINSNIFLQELLIESRKTK